TVPVVVHSATSAPPIGKSVGPFSPYPMDQPRCRADGAAGRGSARMAEPETPNTPPPSTPPPAAEASAMAEAAHDAAQQASPHCSQPAAPPAGAAVPFEAQKLKKAEGEAPPKGIDLLADVNLNVKIELGRTRMLVEDVLKLSDGAVVELDKLA